MLPGAIASAASLEVGCSTGALTEVLSTRADAVLGVDQSPRRRSTAARRRLGDRPGVTLAPLDVPSSGPTSTFDLVVVSEVGYFLSPAALDRLVARVAGSLTPDGVLVLCHWRHRVEGWVMDADEVHRRFEDGPAASPCRPRYATATSSSGSTPPTWPPYDALRSSAFRASRSGARAGPPRCGCGCPVFPIASER